MPNQLTCPHCVSTSWFKGPEGGLAMNIQCAGCECIFWWDGGLGFGLALLSKGKCEDVSVGEVVR